MPRKINQGRAPFDVVVIDEAPEAAVVAAITIISHHKQLPSRNRDRTEIIARRNRRAVLSRGLQMRVRIVHLLAVQKDHAVLDLNCVATDADYALDKIFCAVGRKNKNNNVASM